MPEAVDGRGDLVYLALEVGGVGLVDDAGHTSVFVADDSRVAVRLTQPGCEQCGGAPARPMAVDERRERRPCQQRHVTGQHDDVALVEICGPVGAGQTRERHPDRITGTAGFGLLDELDGEVLGSF